MPESPQKAPAFVAKLTADEVKTLDLLKQVHPAYKERLEGWRVLLDAFEASGGFLDGDYLWPYPKEDRNDFNKRKAMARYHNYLESLVDIYVRFIFSQGVSRSSKHAAFSEWTTNVDGAGLSLEDLLKRAASVGLVHGHAGVLVDKTGDRPVGPAQADERAKVIANVFTAIAISDWRYAGSALAGVKLLEAAPAVDITEQLDPEAKQYLLWDREGWARFDSDGKLVRADTPGLNLVPFAVLRPKPSYTQSVLGRPIVSSPNVIRAMFNRASEEDQFLRDQAFSLLTVEVPQDGNVEHAKSDIGDQVGTSKAVVVRGKLSYETADMTVAEAIRANIEYLVKEMYRAAHMRYQRDSLDAESAEAIRQQHAELNEMLEGLASALRELELAIARYWFAWTFPTPEQAEAAFKAADVQVAYPDEFFLDALINDLEAWAEAIRMDLGETMTKRIKKRAARRVDPDMPMDVQQQVDQEIDAQKDEPPPSMTPLDRGEDPNDTGAAAHG